MGSETSQTKKKINPLALTQLSAVVSQTSKRGTGALLNMTFIKEANNEALQLQVTNPDLRWSLKLSYIQLMLYISGTAFTFTF